MKKLMAAAALAALLPALVTVASAHRPIPPGTSVPIKLDPKTLFDQLERNGR